jgi:chitin synthase
MAQHTRPAEDIVDLSEPSEFTIVDIISDRFNNYNVYTNIGSSCLISVNPGRQLGINDTQTSEEYVLSYKCKENDNIQGKLNPNIFELTNRAYFSMRRTGNDQTVILWYGLISFIYFLTF